MRRLSKADLWAKENNHKLPYLYIFNQLSTDQIGEIADIPESIGTRPSTIQQAQYLQAAINSLTTDQQMILTELCTNGLTQRDLGKKMQIKQAAVSHRLRRIRAKILKFIAAKMEEDNNGSNND